MQINQLKMKTHTNPKTHQLVLSTKTSLALKTQNLKKTDPLGWDSKNLAGLT